MKTLKILGRSFLAALLFASFGAVVLATQTGTNSTQATLFDQFCDQCFTQNANIRNLIASVSTLQDAQTITGVKTFSTAPVFSVPITTAKGLPVILAKSGIPFVSVASGTMGNNGALTVGTALSRTFANAYFFLPAGAIASGVPVAGTWYFTQCSSGTACTVFNNIYTTGMPTVPASPTAFATTGPGAYTGDTGEEFGPTISVPANAMGPNGALRAQTVYSYTNSAGNKTARIRFSGNSGTIFLSFISTNITQFNDLRSITNAGVANSQVGSAPAGNAPFGSTASAMVTSAVDTTAGTTVVHSLQKNTATDNAILEAFIDEVISDGT